MATDKPVPPFPSYRGPEPYVFVCYAHADADAVYAAIASLHQAGINVWYDEGISPGRQWRDELAVAIGNCALFVYFVSPSAVSSTICRKEFNYAAEREVPALMVHLGETEVPPGLALATGDVQALLKHRMSESAFERKLVESVAALLRAEPAPKPHRRPESPPGMAPRHRRRWMLAAALVLIAVVAVALVYRGPWKAAPAPSLMTIAVLQFENFTSDPENDYVSAGLAEEIINLLEKVRSLDVVARTASFYFSGKDLEFTTIAERLKADVILEGSVRREADRFRIAAQLIDGQTGLHQWSEIFEERTSDLMTLQSSIALQVARALTTQLSPDEVAQLERRPTADSDAYARYLQARNTLRVASTASDLNEARRLFQQAAARDPDFVEAQSGLCEVELQVYQRTLAPDDFTRASSLCARLMTGDRGPVEVLLALGKLNRLAGNYREALRLFDLAIEADPDLEPAHYGRAMSLQGLDRLDEAEAELLRGIELEPGYWQTYSGYGVFLALTGRLEEAADQFHRVVELTPENPQGYGNLGTALFALGRWPEAESAWERSLELERTPHGYDNLGTLLYHRARYAAAADLFREGAGHYPDNFRLWGKLGAALAESGQSEAAQEAFERAAALAGSVLDINPDDPFVLVHLCVYHARRQDAAAALPLCDRATNLAGSDPEVWYMRAIALALAGQRSEAEQAVAEALALGYSERVLAGDPVLARL